MDVSSSCSPTKDVFLAPTSIAATKPDAVCVGILATDPLRSIGLQTILEDGLKLRTVILADSSQPRGGSPSVLIMDECFDEQPGQSMPLSRVLLGMPGVAVVVLTRADGSVAGRAAMAAGARAVLPETAQLPEIRACIRAVLRGKIWNPREFPVRAKQKDSERMAEMSLAHRFTPREREVMESLAQGRSNREIAATMGIDEATVKAHLGRMLRKAEATNRVELTLRALAESRAEKSTPAKDRTWS
ncbi:MAG: response regulator transcription factor [Janthinobacterium lividum]